MKIMWDKCLEKLKNLFKGKYFSKQKKSENIFEKIVEIFLLRFHLFSFFFCEKKIRIF